jgi:predicted nucleic acid-binding protein
MRVSLDTNALLALILPDREKERQAVTKILTTNVCNVSDIVFPEIEYVLSKEYGMPRTDIATSLRIVTSTENISCNKALLNRALPLYEAKSALSFVDCCLVHHAFLNYATPLYTSDKKLINQSNGLAKAI